MKVWLIESRRKGNSNYKWHPEKSDDDPTPATFLSKKKAQSYAKWMNEGLFDWEYRAVEYLRKDSK